MFPAQAVRCAAGRRGDDTRQQPRVPALCVCEKPQVQQLCILPLLQMHLAGTPSRQAGLRWSVGGCGRAGLFGWILDAAACAAQSRSRHMKQTQVCSMWTAWAVRAQPRPTRGRTGRCQQKKCTEDALHWCSSSLHAACALPRSRFAREWHAHTRRCEGATKRAQQSRGVVRAPTRLHLGFRR